MYCTGSLAVVRADADPKVGHLGAAGKYHHAQLWVEERALDLTIKLVHDALWQQGQGRPGINDGLDHEMVLIVADPVARRRDLPQRGRRVGTSILNTFRVL